MRPYSLIILARMLVGLGLMCLSLTMIPLVPLTSGQADGGSASVGSSLCPSRDTPTDGETPLSSCVPGIGISIIGSIDGDSFGSCITSGEVVTPSNGSYASCDIALPSGLPSETEITFIEDATTIPSGYDSAYQLGSTIGTSAAYPDSAVVFYHRAVEAGDQVQPTEPTQSQGGGPQTTVEPTVSAATETLTTETDGSNAAIYAGDCDADFTDEPVATLTNVRPPDGDMAGADSASAVETSFTTLDLPLDDILAEDHVLVVFDEDDDTVPLVCGPVGGIVSEDGALVFALPAVGASQYSGVAYLSEDGDQTQATIFLAEDLSADSTPAA